MSYGQMRTPSTPGESGPMRSHTGEVSPSKVANANPTCVRSTRYHSPGCADRTGCSKTGSSAPAYTARVSRTTSQSMQRGGEGGTVALAAVGTGVSVGGRVGLGLAVGSAGGACGTGVGSNHLKVPPPPDIVKDPMAAVVGPAAGDAMAAGSPGIPPPPPPPPGGMITVVDPVGVGLSVGGTPVAVTVIVAAVAVGVEVTTVGVGVAVGVACVGVAELIGVTVTDVFVLVGVEVAAVGVAVTVLVATVGVVVVVSVALGVGVRVLVGVDVRVGVCVGVAEGEEVGVGDGAPGIDSEINGPDGTPVRRGVAPKRSKKAATESVIRAPWLNDSEALPPCTPITRRDDPL